jgi:cyclophilin family peptidyl-prolyl cis-trans isomerase/HEAT repeat protein
VAVPLGTFEAIAVAEDQRRWDAVLQGALADADPVVRRRAVLATGRLQDSTTVATLLPLLADPDTEVRRETAFALGQIGHRSARPALEQALVSNDEDLQALALEALGKLLDPAATPRVTRFLGDASARLRGEAAVALWRLADSSAIQALLDRHDDPDPEVRWRVMYALEKVVAPERVVLVAALHLDDPSERVRAHAARTLGRQKAARGTVYLMQTLRDDDDVAVRVNAARALQGIADSSCVSCGPVLAGLLAHPHPYVRVAAATALGDRFWRVAADSAARAAVAESLAAHVRDVDPATRVASARALIAHRMRVDLDLQPLLADSSVIVRAGQLRNLALLAPADVLPLLIERLPATRPLAERMAACEALGALGDRRGATALRPLVADTSALAAAGAAEALAALGDTASVPELAAAYARWAPVADADARISMRDALRALAGRVYADSVERAHPVPPPPATRYGPAFDLPPPERGALLHTTRGVIEWAFHRDEAPQTVKNFVRLARAGRFDGCLVHRVVPNFVIQDGDPTGTGAGGPGYSIRCEYNRLRYEPGMVGMALSGKDTGGSQWFITHSPQPHLDGRYTIFARVTRGMDVVWRITQGDRIERVEIVR